LSPLKAERVKIATSQVLSYAFVLMTAVYTGCLWNDDVVLPESTGRAGDLLVVMDSSQWAGDLGLQVKKCFAAPQEGLPQSEARFNLIQVTPKSFSQIFKTTRNIVLFERDQSSDASTFALKENVWARNQLVLLIKIGRGKSGAEIVINSCEGLTERFQKQEWKRLQFAFEKLRDEAVMEAFEHRTGVRPFIPTDYTIALEKENFIWLRKDFQQQGHQVSMGIIAYRSPYDSVGALESVNILAERNNRAKVVEGPVEGSHMSTYSEYPPAEREIEQDKKYVKELRGLWNMSGAFMGGPFVHYTFVDKTGKYLIDIDAYVFAPKFDKREYLRELEAIALSGVK
jgi:hypothetical protein